MAACSARRTGRWSTWRTSAGTMRSTRSPATCSSRGSAPAGKIFYTTGRLTSEMVIKTVQMQIPILISRSGFTAWGVDLARQAGLTLIGRARGRRFLALSGEDRIRFDADPASIEDEGKRHRRKGAAPDDAAMNQAKARPELGSSASCSRADRRGAWAVATNVSGSWRDRTILAHVIERIAPQVDALVLNANGDPARFAAFGPAGGAGCHRGLRRAACRRADRHGMGAGRSSGLCMDRHHRHRHAVLCRPIWRRRWRCRPRARRRRTRLRRFERAHASGVRALAGQHWRQRSAWRCWTRTSARSTASPAATVSPKSTFPTEPFDPFFNTNRPEDLEQAGRFDRCGFLTGTASR